MEFVIGLNIVAIIMQLFIIYYGYGLFRMVRPLKFWTKAWGVFVVSMILVVLRRGWSVIDLWGRYSPEVSRLVFEAVVLIVISGLWLVFVSQLRELFKKYLNGEGVLLEREQTVEWREKTAHAREGAVGKREDAVQKREDEQKHSGYYKDWKKDLYL